MTAPIIITTIPASGAQSVPVNTTISIIFDQEVDTYRLENGGLILEGPDQSKGVGPGFLGLYPPDTNEDEFLASPAYKGIADVVYQFERVDGSGNVVPYYDYGNTPNAGHLYRTKVTLTPKEVLGGLTQYTVYIMGDEDQSDNYAMGVTTRTVFDTIKSAVLGNGDVTFYGGYTGSLRDRYHIEITTAGAVGTAVYDWWSDADPIHRSAKSSTGYRLLQNGLKVRFTTDRTYEVGDHFSVWCDVPAYMESSSSFYFTTSEHHIDQLPIPSTMISGTGGTTGGTSTSNLTITSTDPSDRDSLVPISTTDISIVFSAALNSSTVTDSTVMVESLSVDGSIDQSIPYTGILAKTLTISSNVLTVTLDADQLYENNLVNIILDSSIAATTGETLGANVEFFFGTILNPFYAGTRHVRLRMGSIGNVFPDETVNMAIWDASREADAITPPVIADHAAFIRSRNMFVVCLASWYLIGGGKASVSNGSVRKALADLSISRDGGSSIELSSDFQSCFERYELAMRSGGEAGFGSSMRPANTIKGENDPDCPAIGRRWIVNNNNPPNANSSYRPSGMRRWYKTNTRRENE